jgi:hypothetical protein
MCEVHLAPDVSELRTAERRLKCGECARSIRKGTEYRYIDGALDDGSTERWRYVAHDDCYQLSMCDLTDDGCFIFGGARPVGSPSAAVRDWGTWQAAVDAFADALETSIEIQRGWYRRLRENARSGRWA